MKNILKSPFPLLLFLGLIIIAPQASAQVTSGKLTYVFIDSTQYNSMCPDCSETIVCVRDGQETVFLINESNYHIPYESSRDTVTFYFTPDRVVSLSQASVRYYDLKKEESINYRPMGDSLQEAMHFRMYADYFGSKKAEKPTVQEQRSDSPFATSSRYENYVLRSTENNTVLDEVKIEWTTEIEVPILIFSNYWQDQKTGLISKEIRTQHGKTTRWQMTQLIQVEPLPREEVDAFIGSLFKWE